MCITRANFPKRRIDESTAYFCFSFFPLSSLLFSFLFIVILVFVSEKREFQETVLLMSQPFLSGDRIHTTAIFFSPLISTPSLPKVWFRVSFAPAAEGGCLLSDWSLTRNANVPGLKSAFHQKLQSWSLFGLDRQEHPYTRGQRLLPGTAIWLSCKD